MEQEQRRKMIERIRKLASMTNVDSNASLGEVENATKLISDLMKKYALSWADLLDSDEPGEQVQFDGVQSESFQAVRQSWHWKLAGVIAFMTHTRHYAIGARGQNKQDKDCWGWHFAFFGEIGAATTAGYLFDKWVVLLDQMAREATSQYCVELANEVYHRPEPYLAYQIPGLGRRHPVAFRNTWLRSALNAIWDKVAAEQKSSQAQSTALSIFDNALAQRYGEFSKGFHTVGIKNGKYNSVGAKRGAEVGANLNLMQNEFGAAGKTPEPVAGLLGAGCKQLKADL